MANRTLLSRTRQQQTSSRDPYLMNEAIERALERQNKRPEPSSTARRSQRPNIRIETEQSTLGNWLRSFWR
ncbi:hypothetical protein [Streptococcus ferus]|uniref:hypothetical protein n=1 Tax=Streptococcus ferus TaxID=1345 RepID=UPI0023554CFD|nr:hypothetical protein [Streptococcus ferus]